MRGVLGTARSRPTAILRRRSRRICSRGFNAQQPNTKWVDDTTSIWTAEGWLDLAVVLDLFSRMVVGWSMAATQDATLVVQALQMAITRRRPPPGLLHHSDRGSPDTSDNYPMLLAQTHMVVSMSRAADCYDNAAMESFFPGFKGECIEGQSFQTRVQARSVTFDYIETIYNRGRRHSTLRYVSPLIYEQSMDALFSLGIPLFRVKINHWLYFYECSVGCIGVLASAFSSANSSLSCGADLLGVEYWRYHP